MEIFSALMALCSGNSPVTGEFPSQRIVTRSFDVFFHLCLNKRLSKQSRGWLFETPSRSLWHHCYVACRPRQCIRVDIPSWCDLLPICTKPALDPTLTILNLNRNLTISFWKCIWKSNLRSHLGEAPRCGLKVFNTCSQRHTDHVFWMGNMSVWV